VSGVVQWLSHSATKPPSHRTTAPLAAPCHDRLLTAWSRRYPDGRCL